MVRNTKQNWYSIWNWFLLSSTVWFMNEQMNKWLKRLNLVHVKTKPTVLVDCKTFLDSTHSQKAITWEVKQAIIIISSKNYAISTVLWVLSHLAQWHNVLAFRTSRTSRNLREHPGKLRHFRDDPLACWHTSGMLAHWHTHWHSRQTHGIQTKDDHTASHPGRLQTPGSCGRFYGFRVYVTSVDLSQSSETGPTP